MRCRIPAAAAILSLSVYNWDIRPAKGYLTFRRQAATVSTSYLHTRRIT
jgi:hypothetical protein